VAAPTTAGRTPADPNRALLMSMNEDRAKRMAVISVLGSAMAIGGLWGVWDSEAHSFRWCFYISLIIAGSFLIFRVFQEKMFSR
jgi:MFS family permease